MELESPIEEYKIVKHLHRTLPELKKFTQNHEEGGNRLFNVLKAYACYDNKLGYVQGMNYLAAMLLIHIEDEVQAFWCFFSLLQRKNWRKVYDDETPKLMSMLEMMTKQLKTYDKALYTYLVDKQDLSMAAAFSPIFITLFIY